MPVITDGPDPVRSVAIKHETVFLEATSAMGGSGHGRLLH